MVPNTQRQKQNPIPPTPAGDAAYALEAPHMPLPSVEDYAAKIAAEQHIDPIRFRRLIACESRWKEDAAGDNGASLGILQFKASTFTHFIKKYNLEHYDYNRQNPYEQIDLAARMIADGYLAHWKNCARKIGWIDE